MIDSKFIIRYTNALYSTPAEYGPRYDEFRDMFSLGQIRSKEWLIKELSPFWAAIHNSHVVIVGAWFGTLGILLRTAFPDMRVTMLDIDPRCEKFIDNIIYNDANASTKTGDMYDHSYKERTVINTSCEHIPDLAKWVSLIPPGRFVVLQSNNYVNGEGHVNCVSSEDELVQKAGLKEVWYRGKLEMPMYTRYMVMGIT